MSKRVQTLVDEHVHLTFELAALADANAPAETRDAKREQLYAKLAEVRQRDPSYDRWEN